MVQLTLMLKEEWEREKHRFIRLLLVVNCYCHSLIPHFGTEFQFIFIAGYVEIAKILIEKQADVNLRNYFEQTPLHAAAYNNQANLAKNLIEHGVDINARDKCGDTALSIAIENSK